MSGTGGGIGATSAARDCLSMIRLKRSLFRPSGEGHSVPAAFVRGEFVGSPRYAFGLRAIADLLRSAELSRSVESSLPIGSDKELDFRLLFALELETLGELRLLREPWRSLGEVVEALLRGARLRRLLGLREREGCLPLETRLDFEEARTFACDSSPMG